MPQPDDLLADTIATIAAGYRVRLEPTDKRERALRRLGAILRGEHPDDDDFPETGPIMAEAAE